MQHNFNKESRGCGLSYHWWCIKYMHVWCTQWIYASRFQL